MMKGESGGAVEYEDVQVTVWECTCLLKSAVRRSETLAGRRVREADPGRAWLTSRTGNGACCL